MSWLLPVDNGLTVFHQFIYLSALLDMYNEESNVHTHSLVRPTTQPATLW